MIGIREFLKIKKIDKIEKLTKSREFDKFDKIWENAKISAHSLLAEGKLGIAAQIGQKALDLLGPLGPIGPSAFGLARKVK